MLTYQEVKNIKLKRAVIGGYKAEDVNNFIDDIKDSIKKLEQDNSDLLSKVKDLLQKNSKYKEEQESIRVTLVKAQKLADSSIFEAKSQAEEILNKANFDAEKIVSEAKMRANKVMEDMQKEITVQSELLADLKKSVKDFRVNVLSLYKEHIKLVNSLTHSEDNSVEKNSKPVENVNVERINSDSSLDKKVEEAPAEQFIKVLDKEPENEEKKVINKKFINLKFGESYDVAKDVEDQAVGLFSKIQ